MKKAKRGRMCRRNKKAVFFSTDALIALFIIFLTILIIYPAVKYAKHETAIQEDVLKVFSSLKIGEIDNSYAQSLISEGKITDLNNSVLEQIGEFYVTDKALSKNLAQSVLSSLDTKENIGIWYGNFLVASVNSSSVETAENIDVERQVISGIKEGESVTGFSARAYLTNALQKKYFNLGGYVGDGNISTRADYNGNLKDVKIEITTNKDFDLYINNIFSGHYEKSPSEFSPAVYDLDAYLSNFNSGENIMKFVADNLYIAGGYIQITYENSTALYYEEPEKYYFPGIQRLINLYTGLYVPGNLQTLDINLHLNSAYSVFLTIGNVTVFNGSTSGEQTITLDNSQLSSLLNYQEISEKTLPLRLGLENVSYVTNITKQADVFSVTDLSGSMVDTCVGGNFWCCLFSGNSCGTQATCQSCGGTFEQKLSIAKQANREFVDAILNSSGNRVGLVGYRDSVSSADCHALSQNSASLKTKINSWQASGTTCICCGINKAVQDLVSGSSPNKSRVIVVMSDGEANVRCTQQGTGNAKQDAIKAACDAFNNHKIIVHAVGFGNGADVATLRSIASCGNGSYYHSNISEIVKIYQQIAQNIIEALYKEQTIVASGNISTLLYPDSYIKFGFQKPSSQYGLIVTSEEQFSDEYSGSFSIPPDSRVIEARAISYSGPRWTQKFRINNNPVYDINYFARQYIALGDPYSINIPNSLVMENNSVRLTTGISSEEEEPGSRYNKIIYTLIKNVSSYSPISSYAEGCIWNIEFEDNSNLTAAIPLSYTGTSNCYYQESKKEYDSNDAIQTAVYNLLESLDLDLNNKVDVKISEQSLQISSSEITGIPFTWNTEVQVRRWD